MTTTTVNMETKHGEPLQLIKWTDDIIMPGFFPDIQSILQEITELEHREGDVLLCYYPKCGTHWIQALTRRMKLREVEESHKDAYMNQQIGLLESVRDLPRTRSAMSSRILLTRLRPKRIPRHFQECKAKIILMLRNPKDVAVSFYYHLKNSSVFSNKQNWDEFQSGVCPCGRYLDYLKAWDSMLKDNKNLDIEIFYYEDMKTNGLENAKRLAAHLGIDLNDTEVQLLFDECSMKLLEERDNLILRNSKTPTLNKDGKSIMYRKGEIGDWKNHFTVAQNEAYDHILKDSLEDSMFKFKYE